MKISEKTGDVVTTIDVKEKDAFVVSTVKGIIIRTGIKDIRVIGRATSGVRIIKLQHGDKVSDMAKLDMDKEKEIIEKSDEEETGQKVL